MNVWEVAFEVRWDNSPEGVFDELEDVNTVVAHDYDSALETARQVAMAGSYFDDEEGKDHFVKEVRLIRIERGIPIHAVAAVKAA
jgi:hypothetical protein